MSSMRAAVEMMTSSLFPSLARDELQRLTKCAQSKALKAGDFVFREGNRGRCLYIVVEGVLSLESSSGFRQRLLPGDFFGEFAVFGEIPRTASARVLSAKARLMAFGREQLQEAFLHSPKLKDYVQNLYARRFFNQIARGSLFFEGLTKEQLEQVFSHFRPLKISAGKTLIRQGSASNEGFFLILFGYCEALKFGKVIRKMGAGHFFGEIGLLSNSARTASVRAATTCGVLVCSAREFQNLIRKIPRLRRVFAELGKLREPALARKIESAGLLS